MYSHCSVFPHFCGIFAATTVYMLIYSAVRRNNPALFPQIVLPGFISGEWGWGWGGGQGEGGHAWREVWALREFEVQPGAAELPSVCERRCP